MNLNISYNWLKEYIKTDLTPQEFAKTMSLHGPSVDRIHEMKPNFTKVVVGEILKIDQHPDADKLHVCEVNVGKEKLQIVCGAPNILVGQKVPVVLVGGKVGDFEIKSAKLRGVESFGMMCSQKELGLGDDHTGIFILPSDSKIGEPLEKVMPINDVIFDMEVTSNRPDAMSIIGIAREAVAITGAKTLNKEPKPDLAICHPERSKAERGDPAGLPRSSAKADSLAMTLKVTVKEPKLCPKYSAIVITDVEVKPSPLWMQQRLISAGLRPINNLVDITNYILLEYGQPMHVFDYEKLSAQGGSASGGKSAEIIVRLAKKDEKILALDGKEYELTENNLIIADKSDPVAIGGVMGGELSAASDKTKTIVFEVANFDSVSVRKTARALNLHSESSDLYEKGLSPENTTMALLRAIELVQQLANGKIASEIISVKNYKLEEKKIKLDPIAVNNALGVELKLLKMKEILESLGFEIVSAKVSEKAKELIVRVPWWRTKDVEGEHDLIEEIARIYGYHNLPTNLMTGGIPADYKSSDQFFWEWKVKNFLAGMGYCENYNYSFVSDKLIKACGLKVEDCVEIDNPLSSDFQYMRTELIPSMLQAESENESNFKKIKTFELSKVYRNREKDLPEEITRLAILNSDESDEDAFSSLKGGLEVLLSKLNISNFNLKAGESVNYGEKGKCFEIRIRDEMVGSIGMINKACKSAIGIKRLVAVCEINFDQLIKFAKTTPAYAPLPKYPVIELDLSMEIASNILFADVASHAQGVSEIIEKVEFLSVYEGANMEKGKKALAIRLTYRNSEKTLELGEAQSAHEKVVALLQKEYGIKVR